MTTHEYDAWADSLTDAEMEAIFAEDADEAARREFEAAVDEMAFDTTPEPHPSPEQVAADANDDLPPW